MRLGRRIRSVVLDFRLRVVPPRPPGRAEIARQDFSTHPGGKGLRFTQRLRNALRKRWLRVLR